MIVWISLFLTSAYVLPALAVEPQLTGNALAPSNPRRQPPGTIFKNLGIGLVPLHSPLHNTRYSSAADLFRLGNGDLSNKGDYGPFAQIVPVRTHSPIYDHAIKSAADIAPSSLQSPPHESRDASFGGRSIVKRPIDVVKSEHDAAAAMLSPIVHLPAYKIGPESAADIAPKGIRSSSYNDNGNLDFKFTLAALDSHVNTPGVKDEAAADIGPNSRQSSPHDADNKVAGGPVSADVKSPPKESNNDSEAGLAALQVYLRSYNDDSEVLVTEGSTDTESWASSHPGTVISTAVAIPIGVLGGAGYWLFRRRRASEEELIEIDPLDHRVETDFDEDSLGETTEDPFEFKFEVGNDAAMWAHQADFSAF